MLRSLYLLVILGFFSCVKVNKKKVSTISKIEIAIEQKEAPIQRNLNDREKLVKQLLDLFDADFVSMSLIEDLFGRVGVEEETLFFEECESENTKEYCDKAYDNYFKDISKSESYVFKELNKNSLIQELLIPRNKAVILNSLEKVSDNEYQAKVGNDDILKFVFRMNEARTRLVFSDFYINDESIFWDMFTN